MDNCLNITTLLLDLLKVEYTKSFLTSKILEHPNHPSLLSISDTLQAYNINVFAIKVDQDKLSEIPIPAVVQISDGKQEQFTVLTDINGETVTVQNGKRNKEILPTEDFTRQWTGVCLLCETNERVAEPGIKERIKQRKRDRLIGTVVALFLLVLTISSLYEFNTFPNQDGLVLIVNSLLKMTGVGITIVLLWYEIDQFNPVLQQICSGGRNVNCNAVLHSKYASFFNGRISLSSIGLSYFVGTLLCQVFTSYASDAIFITSLLSFTAAPFVIFSLYQQAFVVKQWCKLCLYIQFVLMAEIILATFLGWNMVTVRPYTISIILFFALLPLAAWWFVKPLIKIKKRARITNRNLAKIKNNPEVFFKILERGDIIKQNPVNLGLSLINKTAKHTVIKVCNPYCKPCAKAHLILEELYKEGLINLQIIFTAHPKDSYRSKPVKHFMTIKDDIDLLQSVLNDWYTDPNKGYDAFTKKYPLNGVGKNGDKELFLMYDWCQSQKIQFTPTIYIDGKQLPDEYGVEDLKTVLV